MSPLVSLLLCVAGTAASSLPPETFVVRTAGWSFQQGDPPQEELIAVDTKPAECK